MVGCAFCEKWSNFPQIDHGLLNIWKRSYNAFTSTTFESNISFKKWVWPLIRTPGMKNVWKMEIPFRRLWRSQNPQLLHCESFKKTELHYTWRLLFQFLKCFCIVCLLSYDSRIAFRNSLSIWALRKWRLWSYQFLSQRFFLFQTRNQ